MVVVVLVLAVENLELVELLLGLAQKDLSETLWLDLAITSFTASDGLVCSIFLAVEGDLVILVPVFVAVFAKLKIPEVSWCLKIQDYLRVDLGEMLFFDRLGENSSDDLFKSIVSVGLDLRNELLCQLRLLFGSDLVQNSLSLEKYCQKVF